MFKKMIFVMLTLLLSTMVNAGTEGSIRVSKLSPELMNKIQKGQVQNLVVEFKQGDRLPVNLKAVGDLFESVDSNPTFVEVKRDFYVKVSGPNVHMSFDGLNFKPINELLRGNVSVGANADQGNAENFPASVINVVFSAFVK
jgi:hypothetical protein